jgi:hypothetical protein
MAPKVLALRRDPHLSRFAPRPGRNPVAGSLLHAGEVYGIALCLAGCNASPAQDMMGSFFPAWMLCAAAGVVIAIILRQGFGMLQLNRYLIAPPLTYVCIAVAGTLLVWLLWFGH